MGASGPTAVVVSEAEQLAPEQGGEVTAFLLGEAPVGWRARSASDRPLPGFDSELTRGRIGGGELERGRQATERALKAWLESGAPVGAVGTGVAVDQATKPLKISHGCVHGAGVEARNCGRSQQRGETVAGRVAGGRASGASARTGLMLEGWQGIWVSNGPGGSSAKRRERRSADQIEAPSASIVRAIPGRL
jgi:hypothetical protein